MIFLKNLTFENTLINNMKLVRGNFQIHFKKKLFEIDVRKKYNSTGYQ